MSPKVCLSTAMRTSDAKSDATNDKQIQQKVKTTTCKKQTAKRKNKTKNLNAAQRVRVSGQSYGLA